jgi:hypothetical protein
MKAALREGRIPVLYFAEQDFLNGYFKVRLGLRLRLRLRLQLQPVGSARGCVQGSGDELGIGHGRQRRPFSAAAPR